MRVTLGLLCVCCCALVAVPSSASAATIAVTSTADAGAGTLRAALAAAGPGDTITLPAGTIKLTSGSLSVTTAVTIRGAGARASIVSGNNAYGVFDVTAAGVSITDLTVTQGNGSFGGISASSGLTLSRDAVVYNTSTGSGGGLSVAGAQPLVIDHSLFAHNQAASGGGIYYAAGAASTITNTTIAQNTAAGAAGGLYVEAPGLTLDWDTIVGNVLTGPSGQGGNFRLGGGNPVTMGHTILAGGSAGTGGSGDDCYLSAGSTWTSLGDNAEDVDAHPDSGGPGTCQYYFKPALGDHTGLTLNLSALQDNGGPTETIAPLAGSPVIDAGGATGCPPDDQRGVARPQGAACDIGAVELSTPAVAGTFADTITSIGALLHASADTRGLTGSAHFVYGPTPGFGGFTVSSPLAPIVGGQPATAQLSGLAFATTYYFALVVTSPDGSFTGPTQSFTTAAKPASGPNSNPPPTPKPSCKVPKLAGHSVGAARRLLSRAHCALGRVSKPRRARGPLVVLTQSPRSGLTRVGGTKVNVKLGKPPRHHRRHHP